MSLNADTGVQELVIIVVEYPATFCLTVAEARDDTIKFVRQRIGQVIFWNNPNF